MGSNMQRQAVPLLRPERALGGTGLETQVARDSGMVPISRVNGTVTYVDANAIVVPVSYTHLTLPTNREV